MKKNKLMLLGLMLSVTTAMTGCKDMSKEGAEVSDGKSASADATGPDGALDTFGTIVDEKGNISLPDKFETEWPFIGTWAVAESDGVPSLHNVYMRTPDVDYYREKGEFRDGTVIIKEVRHTLGAQHTTGKAFWIGNVDVWFVMVKDKTNRFPGHVNWGDGWGWGLFKGPDRTKQVSNDYKKDCLGCHEPTRKNDLIYVYGYPSFGEAARKLIPGDTESFDPAIGHGAAAVKEGDQEGKGEALSEEAALGKKLYGQCAACHSTTRDEAGVGPSLFGVVGRRAGSLVSYQYSDAMKKSGIDWTEQNLDKHLKDVVGFIPGNKMAQLYPGGVKDPKERAAVIAYLKTLK